MAEPVTIENIRRLSVAERIRLVEQIWDSVAEESEALALPEAQRAELDARLTRLRTGQAKTVDWQEIKSRLGKQ